MNLMTTSITLTIPDDVAHRAQEIAEQTAQPVEQVLLTHLQTLTESLAGLPAEEQTELRALRYLSDDTLWTIAAEQMPQPAQKRMQLLMDKNSSGTILPEEYAELEALVERGNRLMVRKAEASAILISRGHPFSRSDFKKRRYV
jgi:hypothetical protein